MLTRLVHLSGGVSQSYGEIAHNPFNASRAFPWPLESLRNGREMTLKTNHEQAKQEDQFDWVRAFTGVSEDFFRRTRLDANGRTTPVQRMVIKQSLRYYATQKLLAELFGVNPKTIKKWRERDSIYDKRSGPPKGKSRVVTKVQESYIFQYCARNPGTLNEMLAGLQRTTPHLTRSILHRLLKRSPPEHVLKYTAHLYG
jgi:hypothetical protein